MKLIQLTVLLSLLTSATVLADGRVVDKVYHPYVQPLEREFEYRALYQRQTDHPNNNAMAQKLGYGFSIADNMAVSLYLLAERVMPDDYTVSSYEAELRWMLTEQGQYSWDWGLLFELEHHQQTDNNEFTTGLLVEKEFENTSVTVNTFLVYEWGASIKNELETELRLQYRYRYLPALQPSIEVYAGEGYKGAGPGFMGVHKFSPTRQLKWEAAVVFALDNDTIDRTVRFALKYEF
ncbi:hypothetical protein [Rheinheimera baltica]|uniref:hypothetical protein n=1 Tax=Rheinheimera baltica TaxID=67576 RepID=UPI00041CC62C|nr:hypothetical protein [Rheinheimera baltica]MDP5144497.1 hypothetical protein [Rheinheimera baltica]MDP5149101.1 hypothetical protein [Rheinheimera baltica]MDP5190402.1 hypothetical protein [Rheinheimera baltica]